MSIDSTDLESVNTEMERSGSIFIPGITAKARCLSNRSFGETFELMEDDSADSTYFRRRSSIVGQSSRSKRSFRSKKDSTWDRMKEDIIASRKAADEAREIAIRVKKKFSKEASDRAREFCLKQLEDSKGSSFKSNCSRSTKS